MPMKGRFPIRRTLQYLSQGNVVFKESVKVMTVNYNTHGELGEGARSVAAPAAVTCYSCQPAGNVRSLVALGARSAPGRAPQVGAITPILQRSRLRRTAGPPPGRLQS